MQRMDLGQGEWRLRAGVGGGSWGKQQESPELGRRWWRRTDLENSLTAEVKRVGL